MGETAVGRPVVVVGAGGHGREVLDVIEAINEVSPCFRFVGYVADGPQREDRLSARNAVLLDGFDDPRAQGAAYLGGVGDPHVRRALSDRADAHGLQAASAIHPSSRIGSVNVIADGFVACALSSVTTNVVIGRHVHLNVHSGVAHDCVLGDFVTLNPGAHVSGEVRLGDGVIVGSGAVVIQGITIGSGSVIGAGSVVTRDLPAGVVAFGSPARPVRSLG